MQTKLIFGVFASLVLSCCLVHSVSLSADSSLHGVSTERLKRIDNVMLEYIDQGRLPGAAWIVARNGETVGSNQLGGYSSDSIFRIYSMTKPITVVATLMLFEQGRFLLSDPISLYLPEFESMDVLEMDSAGVNFRRPAKTPITIEQLLTHTSGLSYDDSADGVPSLYASSDIWQANSLADFTQRLTRLPLAFEPGERWHYSVAMDVLGRLVEVIADQPLDEYLQQHIFDPLHMQDTGFYVPADKLERFLPMYRHAGDSMERTETAQESSYLDRQNVPYGGHGLVSTASDYMSFCQMLLNGGELDGERLLGRKTVQLMIANHLGPEFPPPKLNEPWVADTENRSGDLNLGLGFGYGGYVIENVSQNAIPGTQGTYAWGGNSSTYFFIDPAENMAAIFMTQLSPSSSYPLRAQSRALVYQALVD